jgi:putative ABC transport system permease protein
VTVALPARPLPAREEGGPAARRALARWSWRLFRREWRQQVLVLVLLTLAVAATVDGLGIIVNTAVARSEAVFGSADHILTVAGPDVAAEAAAARRYFGTVEVVGHDKLPVPGSTATVDLRSQDPAGVFTHGTLRLDSGRWPRASDEIAMTHGVAADFGLHVGSAWTVNGAAHRVVGVVENPKNLLDDFALVAPGAPTALASVLVTTTDARMQGFRVPGDGPRAIMARGTAEERNATLAVLIVAAVGLMFVGLLAVGGFAVVAARRQRALGMLGAIGATRRHIRLVMLANGAAVGVVGAVVGFGLGLGLWLVLAPRIGDLTDRRIDRFHLPWWAIGSAMVLAVVTAVTAAWWPARASARASIVTALSGRPQPPRPARHFAVLGLVVLAAGVGLLLLGRPGQPLPTVAGVVTTTIGMLLLTPLAIRGGAALVGTRAPVAVRLALRDLVRFQVRAGAALAAITLALGIATAVAVSAAAQAADESGSQASLPDNALVVFTSGRPDPNSPLPELSAAQVQAAAAGARRVAAAVGARAPLELEQAIDPGAPTLTDPGNGVSGRIPAALAEPITHNGQKGFSISPSDVLYVATPEVLARYGIKPADLDPAAVIVTSRPDVRGKVLFAGDRQEIAAPKVQLGRLPSYTGEPGSLLTPYGLSAYGLQGRPAAWLVETARPLSGAQITAARHAAAAAGLTVETQPTHSNFDQLRTDATAIGIVVALGVLAMTIGLLRTEAATDLRTLTATGASSRTRRTLTATTAGALATMGALLGSATAYAALLAGRHRNLDPLGNVPVADLLALIVGLPVLATLGGWLLAGRQPPAIARQALD